MSYQIDFRGRDEDSITVNTERGEKIKAMWFDGKKDTPIDIDGDAYLIGNIKAIKQVTDPKPPVYLSPERLLDDGNKCRGTFSIQSEINNIIKHDHPKTWAKEIRNNVRREEIRKQLRSHPDVQWCDAKVGECAC